tara:strand:- start:55157 stop:57409 length:2253 start_codon:yes stop_codon:yes gene_type:complete
MYECDERFSKNLVKGSIYKFYKNYDFLDEKERPIYNENLFIQKDGKTLDNTVRYIKNNKSQLENLYQTTTVGNNPINIQISSIVGRNGSGKSTLLDLLYALCYVIATKKGIISDHSDLSNLINKKGVDHNKVFGKIYEIQDFYKDLRVEIFYELDGEFYSVSYYDDQLLVHREISNSDSYKNFEVTGIYNPGELTDRKFDFVFDKLFFYTISVNYSLYGLNTNNDSSWLGDLFHKNDGYQTPLVINPYRNQGNIDVNSELHLAQSRLLSNLVDDNFSAKKIINNKTVQSIQFVLDYSQYNTFKVFEFDTVYEKISKKLNLDDAEFITQVYNAIYTTKGNRISKIDLEKIENSNLLVKYVYKKILKIHTHYDEYRAGTNTKNIERLIPSFIQIFKSLIKLKDDRSHITLKLRQILNTIRFNILKSDKDFKWLEESDDFEKRPDKIKKHIFTIDLDAFIKRIKAVKKSNPDLKLVELMPIGCFRPNLFINNDSKDHAITNFQSLSSGEQHFVHSIQSILYHISNIESVFHSTTEKIRYNYINLVFDEIELYYHPDFQRSFISELLIGIENLKIPNIKGINILLSTHSPFILSDITNNSILKLKDGNIDNSETSSFAANVHDILADDFFLDKGFMGTFSKGKIDELINWLNFKILEKELNDNVYKNISRIREEKYKLSSIRFDELKLLYESKIDLTPEYCLSLIKIIDEPLLKNKLSEMYYFAYQSDLKQESAEEQIKAFARKLGRDDIAGKI